MLHILRICNACVEHLSVKIVSTIRLTTPFKTTIHENKKYFYLKQINEQIDCIVCLSQVEQFFFIVHDGIQNNMISSWNKNSKIFGVNEILFGALSFPSIYVCGGLCYLFVSFYSAILQYTSLCLFKLSPYRERN